MAKLMRFFTVLFFVVAVGAASSVLAQSADVIQAIEINGNQRVDDQTVRSYLSVNEGDTFDASLIDSSLKRMFATELFADIRMRRSGSTLSVDLQENPVINIIAFEGNKNVKDEVLANEVQLKPRFVFTARKARQDTQRIIDIYRRSGRYGVTVEPKIIKLDQNRINLVFEISEGKTTYVERIIFKGNTGFSDETLRSTIATKEEAWFRVLSSNDTYDPDRLNFDKELLRRFYLENGYADFQVTSATAELSPTRDAFLVTFNVSEGPQYTVNQVLVDNRLKRVEEASFVDAITVEENETYDARQVEESISGITDELGNQGYAFVDVEPQVDRDPVAKTLDVEFNVNEAPKVFVDKIEIRGNVRTLDEVVRREFELAEGDPFNTSKLRRSNRNLRNLGFFETVDVDTQPGSAPDRVDIVTTVQEKSTGELSFGAGFSTNESVLGNIRLRERNFLGKGQDLRFSATASARRTEFDVGFTEPYFLGRKLAAGFDLFNSEVEIDDDASFSEDRVGGRLSLGYDLTPDLSQRLTYLYEDVTIEDIDANASTFIQQQAGQTKTSEFGQTLTYDKRDSRFDPSNGYFWRVGTFGAGIGGDAKYAKATFDAGYYTPLWSEEWILGLIARAGYIEGLDDDDVRISDRFFLGRCQASWILTNGCWTT